MISSQICFQQWKLKLFLQRRERTTEENPKMLFAVTQKTLIQSKSWHSQTKMVCGAILWYIQSFTLAEPLLLWNTNHMLGTLDFTGSEHSLVIIKNKSQSPGAKVKKKIKILPLNCIQITFFYWSEAGLNYTSLNLL